jgi:hypothetical protein
VQRHCQRELRKRCAPSSLLSSSLKLVSLGLLADPPLLLLLLLLLLALSVNSPKPST